MLGGGGRGEYSPAFSPELSAQKVWLAEERMLSFHRPTEVDDALKIICRHGKLGIVLINSHARSRTRGVSRRSTKDDIMESKSWSAVTMRHFTKIKKKWSRVKCGLLSNTSLRVSLNTSSNYVRSETNWTPPNNMVFLELRRKICNDVA